MRRALVAAAVLATACLSSAVALAAQTAVSLSVTPSVVHRGQIVSVDGNAGGCSVGNTVFVISRAFAGAHEFAGVPAVVPNGRAAAASTRRRGSAGDCTRGTSSSPRAAAEGTSAWPRI